MKRNILFAGMITQLIFTGELLAQDTTKTTQSTTTTTTTTTTEDTVTTPKQTPAPVVAPAPAPVADDRDEPNPVPKFYLGARYMPTFTHFDVNTNDNGTAETSFAVGHGVGGYMGTNFNKNVGLQLEVIYSELSQKYKYQGKVSKVGLSYLHIPLMLVLNTDITKPVNFNITAGPQIGINVGTKYEDYENSGNDSIKAVVAVKQSDLGFAYGAGFDFRLAKEVQLGIGFRGVYGLVDISDKSRTRSTGEYLVIDKTHINTYAAYIGLRFNFY